MAPTGQDRRCWSLGRRVRTSLDSRLGRAANNRDRAVLCRAGLGSEIAAIFRWRRPIDEASAPPEPPAPAVSGDRIHEGLLCRYVTHRCRRRPHSLSLPSSPQREALLGVFGDFGCATKRLSPLNLWLA